MFDTKSLTKGSKGEEKVAEWLLNNGYTVHDLRNNYEARKKDIDFLAEKGDDIISLEVKSQSNVAYDTLMNIEDILNIRTGRLGWIHYCEADFIIIYSHDRLFIFKPEEMRQYIQETDNKKVEIVDPIIEDSVAIVHKVPLSAYKKTGRYFRSVDI